MTPVVPPSEEIAREDARRRVDRAAAYLRRGVERDGFAVLTATLALDRVGVVEIMALRCENCGSVHVVEKWPGAEPRVIEGR